MKYAFSITLNQGDKPFYEVFVKGAPEILLNLSSHVLIGNEEQKINSETLNTLQMFNDSQADEGLRVLSFAKMKLQLPVPHKFDLTEFENEFFSKKTFTFIGLLSLQDPPKPAVKQAVEKCKTAGIKVIMVTGDQPKTAQSIARQVGIITQETNLDAHYVRRPQKRWVEPKALVITGEDILAAQQY